METLNFHVCTTANGVYYHAKRGLRVVTHVDDFLCSGAADDLRWLKGELAKEFELKHEILGIEAGESRIVRFLGRSLTWTPEGIEYEGDQKHAQIVGDVELQLSTRGPFVLEHQVGADVV